MSYHTFVRLAPLLVTCVCCTHQTFAAPPASLPFPPITTPPYLSDRILIKPNPGVDSAALAGFSAAHRGKVLRIFEKLGDMQVVRVPAGETVPGLVARYQRSGLVEFAEPDYTGRVFATPNDPKLLDGTLWGLHNTGQSGGAPGADIDALGGWDILHSASNIVVAVIDTGVRATHEDLAANMWINPSDGSHGTNALAGTTNPSDDSGHGTLVAGVLGAVGDNGKGITGVAWRLQLMACKAFNNFGVGNVSAAVACLEYARAHGAVIINASWGFTNSLALSNAIAGARQDGIIVVAAAGNSAANIDEEPVYPAGYDLDNVVTVAYTSRHDALSANSNYGAASVDLAAPGEQIHSTFGAADNFYFTSTGSSFAASYVAGALALMRVKHPGETPRQIIARLLRGVDPVPALAGRCVTGGRLNLRKALEPPILLTAVSPADASPFHLRLSAEPDRTLVIEISDDLTAWTPVFTNTTSVEGTFDFVDEALSTVRRRFYRAVKLPLGNSQ